MRYNFSAIYFYCRQLCTVMHAVWNTEISITHSNWFCGTLYEHHAMWDLYDCNPFQLPMINFTYMTVARTSEVATLF
jgi:hypothetical protein